jgi:DNA-binding NarL/FixJ family response regulator
MAGIAVALVEDHGLVRHAFRRLLEENPHIKVVGEGRTGLDALELARRHHPDVMLLDMVMPELNGLEAAEQIRRIDPAIRLMILSIYSDEVYVTQALRVGVTGYVLKDAIEMDLARAVVSVAEGRPYLSPAIAKFVMKVAKGGQPEVPTDPLDRLTPRERQILQMVAEGLSNKEVAQRLEVTPKTVAIHRANLMRKLDIRGTAQLTLFAAKRGLVKVD